MSSKKIISIFLVITFFLSPLFFSFRDNGSQLNVKDLILALKSLNKKIDKASIKDIKGIILTLRVVAGLKKTITRPPKNCWSEITHSFDLIFSLCLLLILFPHETRKKIFSSNVLQSIILCPDPPPPRYLFEH